MMPEQLRKMQQRSLQLKVLDAIAENDNYEESSAGGASSFHYSDQAVEEQQYAHRTGAFPAEHEYDLDLSVANHAHRENQYHRRRRGLWILVAVLVLVVLVAAIAGGVAARSSDKDRSNVDGAVSAPTLGNEGGVTPAPVTAKPPPTLMPASTPTAAPVVSPPPPPTVAPVVSPPPPPSRGQAFTTTEELHAAVDSYLLDSSELGDAYLKYGDITYWNVSLLTNLGFTFDGLRNNATETFDADLSGWDVSQVTTMEACFRFCPNFRGQGLEMWNTQRVVSFYRTFNGAAVFNGNIGLWQVGAAQTFSHMFNEASAFNQDLSGWDTSSARAMDYMFSSATAFASDVSSWNTSNVVDMTAMFANAENFNSALNWNTGKVNSTAFMFLRARSFDQDLNWNTSSVIDMSHMFREASGFDSDLSGLDTSNVQLMSYMFSDALSFSGYGLEQWNVQRVLHFGYMFRGCWDFAADIAAWNVSSAITLDAMFYDAGSFNADLSNWTVVNVERANEMFKNALSFSANLCSWGPDLQDININQLESMFADSNCPEQSDPFFVGTLLSPLCEICEEPNITATSQFETPGTRRLVQAWENIMIATRQLLR